MRFGLAYGTGTLSANEKQPAMELGPAAGIVMDLRPAFDDAFGQLEQLRDVTQLCENGEAIMIRTAYNNRFRDHKGAQSRAPRPGRRDAPPRRDGSFRQSTVVHPWMSLPERLAAAQAAMRELAGNAAFQCPLGDSFGAARAVAQPAPEIKPPQRPGGVNIIVRKRRLPAAAIASLTSVG
ncbi:MAG: hypothetical protein IT531_05710 [Burkholderiales bacterium]|nr:hypothetical protein [Burkholderiales bacterium]